MQSMPLHPNSCRCILILSSHLLLGLTSGHFPSGYPTKTLYTLLHSPIYATCPVQHFLIDLITRTLLAEENTSLGFSLMPKCSPQHTHIYIYVCVCVCVSVYVCVCVCVYLHIRTVNWATVLHNVNHKH